MAELSRSAFENFEKERPSLANLETRAAVETSAALWYLHSKLDATRAPGALGDVDDFLMRLSMGSKTALTSCPRLLAF